MGRHGRETVLPADRRRAVAGQDDDRLDGLRTALRPGLDALAVRVPGRVARAAGPHGGRPAVLPGAGRARRCRSWSSA